MLDGRIPIPIICSFIFSLDPVWALVAMGHSRIIAKKARKIMERDETSR